MQKTKFADVIIVDQRARVLLLRRNNQSSFMPGKWCLPGGHVDEGEVALKAAARETVEETGLSVDCIHLCTKEYNDCVIDYFQGFVVYDKQNQLNEVLLDNDEHIGFEWVDVEKVSDKDLICELNSTLPELLDLCYKPLSSGLNLRELTPEESDIDLLHSTLSLLSSAFNNDIISLEEFVKALELNEKALKKQSLDVLRKAFNQDLITEDQYFKALIKSIDPSNGGKLIKKTIIDKKGRQTTKWVNPKEEKTEKVKGKQKKEVAPQWYHRFKKYELNCYPIGIDEKDVDINEEGDVNSHWILRWRDPKSNKLKNAYSKEFMDRNAKEKWNRIKDISSETIQSIKSKSKDMFQDISILDEYRQAAAIVNIISHTGLRRGDKEKFKATGNRGVSSLSPDNITIDNGVVSFDFTGKSYQKNTAQIVDKELANYLSDLKEKKRGSEFLFNTTDVAIDTTFDKCGGKGFKIKDIRTYVACDVARQVLFTDPLPPPPVPKDINKQNVKKLIEQKLKSCYEIVAEKLNNTPTMAKNSYIHPNIIDFWVKSLGVNFEIKKGSILGSLGDAAISFIKSIIKGKNNIPTLDEILNSYPKEIIQETDCINEEDEEDCDTFNEPSWVEDELQKSQQIVEEYFEKGGRRATIGEIRMFGRREYIKTAEGWKFHGKGTGVKARGHVSASKNSGPEIKTRREKFQQIVEKLPIALR